MFVHCQEKLFPKNNMVELGCHLNEVALAPTDKLYVGFVLSCTVCTRATGDKVIVQTAVRNPRSNK